MFHQMRAVIAAGMAIAAVVLHGAPAAAQLAHHATIEAGDGVAGDELGTSVAIDGGTAVVGAPGDDGATGAVYVYVHAGGAWIEQARLTASNPVARNRFGYRVAIDGDTLIATTLQLDSPFRGAAYVFVRSGGVWTEEARFTIAVDNNRFGSSVALQGDAAVVGAPGNAGPGSAYVYTRSNGAWTMEAQLRATAPASAGLLGWSVAIDDNTVMAGATQGDSTGADMRGAVYVFVRSDSGWAVAQAFSPADGAFDYRFGSSIAIAGGTAIVGARNHNLGGIGGAYVYTRDATGRWTSGGRLPVTGLTMPSRFGNSVAFDGATAVVGAPDQDGRGAVYVFTRAGAGWTPQQKLAAPDGAASDLFGVAVAFEDGIVLAGAPARDTGGGANRGAAYVFGAPLVLSHVEQQVTLEDVPLGPIAVTLDADPNAAIAITSSNPALVPETSVVLGGTRPNRTLTMTPEPNQSGTAIVTITVRDGLLTATDSFPVTVLPVNDAPTMSHLHSGTIDEDGVFQWGFVVADVETEPGALGVWVVSTNPGLVSVEGGVTLFPRGGGEFAARARPARDAHGTVGLAVVVTDGQALTVQSFILTVLPVNDQPTISSIGRQQLRTGQLLAPQAFTVDDVDTGPAGLSVTARSSNPALVPDGNLVVHGAGRTRTIAAVPVDGATGTTTITLTVSDGVASAVTVFTLTLSEDGGSHPTILTASDGAFFDRFGGALAIEGDTLVVGAAGVDRDTGAAYVFAKRAGLWVETAKLVAPDADGGANFGASVAIDGVTILVSAPQRVGSGSEGLGAVYVFVRQGEMWRLQATLAAPPGATYFGRDVALDGDWALAGAPAPGVGSGRAYAIERQGDAWLPAVRLEPLAIGFDEFGASVAIEGDIAVVGDRYRDAVGAVHVFRRGAAGWAGQDTLVPGDDTPYAFGWDVAIDGGAVLVGSPGTDNQYGAIYRFSPQGTGWTLEPRFTVGGLPLRIGSAPGANVGVSLAVERGRLLTGRTWHDGVASAHLFIQGGGSWTASRALPVDGSFGGLFYATVAVSGETIAVGAEYHPNASGGAVYLFDNDGPVLSGPEALVTLEDVPLGPMALTATDPDDLDAVLTISVSSSNPAVVADAGLVVAGTGSARTLAIAPVDDASGTSELTVTIGDGGRTTTRTIAIHVLPVNDAPQITTFADQTVDPGVPTTLPFEVSDVDASAASLDVWATSTDHGLVPAGGLVVGGAGAARTLTVSPAADRPGTASILVHVSDGYIVTTTAFDFTVAVPPAPTYPLAEGATGSFFDLDILIANPHPVAVPVGIAWLTPAGTRVTQDRVLAPTSRTTIRVDEVPGLEATAVSTLVTSPSGRPLVVERTMWWDASGYGAHTERASGGPAATWYFAEGAQGFFSTYLLLVNPDPAANRARITYLREGAAPLDREYALAPQARLTIDAGADADLVGRSFGAVVRFDRPGVAERAMYFGRDPLWTGGHGSAGVTAPSATWFLAEGATGRFFSTYLLLANPEAADAIATLTYFPAGGVPVTRQRVIPALGRATIDLAGEDPALADAAVATRVEATGPIVVERAQYWAPPAWHEAHNSFGVTEAATHWGLAEGRVGGPRRRQTYILLANPGAEAADVTIAFLRESGAPIVKRFRVPAASRVNVAVAGPGSAVPELADEDFGADIVSTQPIVVERALYSDANGVTWAAGTNATATRLP